MLFEIHCHSTYSDGSNTPKEIVGFARKNGLSGIAITDHDAIAGSLEALNYASRDFKVVPGMEISAVEGHIIALNVRELVPRDLPAAKTIEMIHSQGGLAVAAHPYDVRRYGVGDLITKLPFDAVEVVNGHTFANRKDPVKVCRAHGIPMVGGSDAHSGKDVGSVAVEYDGDVLAAIKSGRTAIRNKPMAMLIVNHAVDIVRRKALKHLK